MTDQSALILRTALLPLMMMMMMMYRADAKMEIITSKQDVEVGEETFLLCKAGGEGEITWLKDGEEVTEDSGKVSVVDESSAKYVIKKATMQDSGRYTCQCEFESGHSDNVQYQLYVYEGPSFGNTAIYHEFLEGTNGLVPCIVTGQPAVNVHWLRDKQKIPTNEGMRVHQLSDNTLFIEKVKREDAGTYSCEAQIRGRPINKKLSVSVVVNVPPTVHLKEKEKIVFAGQETNISLLCLVDGQPKPNINWTMPVTFDPSHHHFNSDRSQLTIRSVARADYGEYVCTATNKIAEASETITLHVYEAPEVFVSAEQQSVPVGDRVSVSCNVTGHPEPKLHWLNKHNGQKLESTSGRVHVVNGELIIKEMMPSDGGLYSCMAVSTSGNASRDVAIHTSPDMPYYLSVSPGPASVFFSLKTLPISGGTPITSFVLQWRQSAAEKWKEVTVPASDPLAITSLKQYTQYTVRVAALNAVGLGHFSDTKTVRTQGIREPDSPVLSADAMKVESNSFFVPLKQSDDGGSPLQHFNIRYGQNKEETEWKEMQLPSDADSISLKDLSFGSDYQLEVTAINANGTSLPAVFNFTIGEEPVKASSRMTKGSVIGIVIVIFLLVFLVVDATCCYRNHCGLLMYISVKIFGHKVPGRKMLEDGEGATNGDVKLKGISTPRGSMQMAGVKKSPTGELTEVTCDKASLTKHEKEPPGRDLPIA